MLDYIIVGAGLSGISIAEELINRGKSVMVYENDSQNSSTVAGGIFNPVILKRFTQAWNAGEQLQIALPFYRSLENKLGIKLIEDLPIYRKFNSIEEQNNWFSAMDKPQVEPFLDSSLTPSVNKNIPSNFSFGRVKGTGRIDTSLLIKKYRQYLKDRGSLISAEFDHAKLILEEKGVSYEDIKAEKILFCEGFGMVGNPYFNFLPLHGNKGEYLVIKSKELKLDVAVKSSVFILPLGDDLYKIGATYDHSDTSQNPTTKARETLESQVRKMLICDFEIIDQVAGIRPATNDRKPIVGKHPVHSRLYCCNGYGSRGVLIAPTVAKEFAEFLEEGKPLDPEIDLKRYL
ncbi:MAG TPA: FAD-binding oxidoreductase [Gillisia sp.]|nr:FAD-binding oxidoreductase [Gillisia sp.]